MTELNPSVSLAGGNEAQTEDEFIRPVLHILGFEYIVQTVTGGAIQNFPDYALFGSATDRDRARHLVSNRDYTQVVAIGEGKRWGRDLDRITHDTRDYLTNRNPGFQIITYLNQTGLDWGLLTNGRLWRLYSRLSPQPIEAYYEVDLIRLVESGGDHQFLQFFWGFFSAAALREGAQGRHVERVRVGSRAYAVTVGDELRQQVFPALERLAAGFLRGREEPLSPEDLTATYEHALIVLYRLLFVLYAEARELLPLDSNANYRDQLSLHKITKEIAHLRVLGRQFSSTSTVYWDRLRSLWRAIDEGDNDLGVPLYDGELFDPVSYPYLATHSTGDRFLAEAIDLLAHVRVDGVDQSVDYRQLSVAHLGTVYEGLLEHRLSITEDRSGSIEDRLDLLPVNEARHQTGSYYTPHLVVQHIVREALEPLIAGRRASDVLTLNVVDPAMGSGHFLVEAVDYLALAVATSPDYTDEHEDGERSLSEIKRRVAEHCIWGIDLNPLAVELAKLSLWLATASADKPLTFLDHRLRLGNSVLGARALDVGRLAGSSQQASVFDDVVALKRADDLRTLEEFEATDPDSAEGIDARKALYDELTAGRERLRAVFDLAVACSVTDIDFDEAALAALIPQLQEDDEGWATAIDKVSPALTAVRALRPFHWELEFPELVAEGGFDAFVGNPPYVNAWEMTSTDPVLRATLARLPGWTQVARGHWDLFVLFLALGERLVRDSGVVGVIVANPFARERYATRLRQLYLTGTFRSVVDFGDLNVFDGVARETWIVIWQKVAADVDHDVYVHARESIQPDSLPTVERLVSQELWRATPDNVFRLDLTAERFAELTAIDVHWRVKDAFYLAYGAQISSAEPGAFGRDTYLAEASDGMTDPKRFYEGRHMRAFFMDDPGMWLDYRPDLMYGTRTPEFFASPKLSIRKVSGESDSFNAWVDVDGFYTDDGVSHATPWHYLQGVAHYAPNDTQLARSRLVTPWFLLGAVMSRPVLDYYGELRSTGSLQGAYSHVYPNTVKELPLPTLTAPIADPPDGWNEQMGDLPDETEAATEALIERLGDRETAANVLAAAAQRRQEIEFEIAGFEREFIAWIRAIAGGGWRWPQGKSLRRPPTRDEFVATLPAAELSIGTFTEVTETFKTRQRR